MPSSPNQPSLVIFDCDGVLVDSEPVANRILAEHLTAAGLEITVDEARRDFVGTSMDHVMTVAEDRLGRPLPEGWLDRLRDATFAAFRQSLEPVPGVHGAIASIKGAGLPICVASSGPVEKMEVSLGVTGLIDHFDNAIFSSTMVARGKPHPDIFLHVADRMGHAPERCIVIEDSLPGVRGARAAGMRVLGYVGDPATERAMLAAAGAELLEDMADLARMIGITR